MPRTPARPPARTGYPAGSVTPTRTGAEPDAYPPAPPSPPAAISSRSNALAKTIRALRRRSDREATGCLFVEGVRGVAEAVRQGHEVEILVVAPDLLKSPLADELIRDQESGGVAVRRCTAEVFASFSLRESPQGIGAVVRQRWTPLPALRSGQPPGGRAAPETQTGWESPGWVALDAARDPGNLGTILRTCDAAGCAGVVLIGHTADPYDPLAVRASMGAVFALPLVRTDFPAFLAWRARTGLQLVGTSGAAPLDYRAAPYRPPVVLLMGNERTGLTPAQQSACDVVVRIPMAGRGDSLNLAVATGIMLYEVRRFVSAR
jgi:RNA methyltransferase, TrmH family